MSRSMVWVIVSATLAPDFDDLEPRLTRQGYSVKVLADQFQAKPAQIIRAENRDDLAPKPG